MFYMLSLCLKKKHKETIGGK